MLASDHAETQQGGVLDGIEQYELPRSTVVRIAKTAVRVLHVPQASLTRLTRFICSRRRIYALLAAYTLALSPHGAVLDF
jgi:hypothetical protein